MKIALLLIKLEHVPLVDNNVGYLTHIACSFNCLFEHNIRMQNRLIFSFVLVFILVFEGNHTKLQHFRH